jgi:hypothetical protein
VVGIGVGPGPGLKIGMTGSVGGAGGLLSTIAKVGSTVNRCADVGIIMVQERVLMKNMMNDGLNMMRMQRTESRDR